MRGRLRPRPHASGHNCHSKIGQNIQEITHVMPVESIEHVVQARLVPAGRTDLLAGGCQRCQMGPSHHHVQTGRARPHRVLPGTPNASECDCDTCRLSEHKLARAVSLLCASRSSDVDLPPTEPKGSTMVGETHRRPRCHQKILQSQEEIQRLWKVCSMRSYLAVCLLG